MTGYIQVLTATGGKDDAERIAAILIDERLAACVQVLGPMASTYRWRGEVETSQEWLCVVKSREDLYGEVEKSIRAVHPYEEPEILALPVLAGSASYLGWLDGELRPRLRG